MAATARKLDQFAESLEPAFRREFLAAVAQITDRVGVQLIAGLLEAGQIDDVMRVLGIDEARFAGLAEALRGAYTAGGQVGAAEMPKIRLTLAQGVTGSIGTARMTARQSPAIEFRFDLRSPKVERWLATNSSRLIGGIVADQREVIRQTLVAGMAAGHNPRKTALEIVGRIGTDGRRSGGVVGLTANQAGFVRNMRAELANPALMGNYFTRTLRDKRFDRLVRKAMEAGKPLSAEDVEKLAGRYSDRLLAYRATVIARSESLTAMAAGREQSFQQAIDAGTLRPEEVECTWSATGDERTRHSHMEANGQKRQFGQPFQMPSGALLMFPGDTSMGAGSEETIGCRCAKTYFVRRRVE